MSKVGFVDHAGATILSIDLTGATDPDEIIQALAQAESLICACPPRSVRSLTNVTDTRYNKATIDRLRQLSKNATPYLLASAAVGVTGLKEVVARGLFSLIGRKVRLFPTLPEALDWLAQQ